VRGALIALIALNSKTFPQHQQQQGAARATHLSLRPPQAQSLFTVRLTTMLRPVITRGQRSRHDRGNNISLTCDDAEVNRLDNFKLEFREGDSEDFVGCTVLIEQQGVTVYLRSDSIDHTVVCFSTQDCAS